MTSILLAMALALACVADCPRAMAACTKATATMHDCCKKVASLAPIDCCCAANPASQSPLEHPVRVDLDTVPPCVTQRISDASPRVAQQNRTDLAVLTGLHPPPTLFHQAASLLV